CETAWPCGYHNTPRGIFPDSCLTRSASSSICPPAYLTVTERQLRTPGEGVPSTDARDGPVHRGGGVGVFGPDRFRSGHPTGERRQWCLRQGNGRGGASRRVCSCCRPWRGPG